MVTREQIDQLVVKVQTVQTDKADADAKTQTSNQKDTEAGTAVAVANQAKLDEAQADGKVKSELDDLEAFIHTLTTDPAPAPAPDPTEPTQPPEMGMRRHTNK